MNETKRIELRRAGRHHGEVWKATIDAPLLYTARGTVEISGFQPDPGDPELATIFRDDRDPRIDMWIGAYGVRLEELQTNRDWYIRDSVGGGALYRTLYPGTEIQVVLRGAASAVRIFVELECFAEVVTAEPCTKMVQIRAPESWIESVDRWRASQRIRMSRSEAIRHLALHSIEIGTRI